MEKPQNRTSVCLKAGRIATKVCLHDGEKLKTWFVFSNNLTITSLQNIIFKRYEKRVAKLYRTQYLWNVNSGRKRVGVINDNVIA